MKNILSIIMILILSMFLAGCDKDIEFVNTTPDTNDTDVGNKAPVANAGDDKNTTVGTPIKIEGSGTDSDGQIVDYEWREEKTLISGLKNFSHVFSKDGNHTLTLIVLDDDGKTGKDTMIVEVTPK